MTEAHEERNPLPVKGAESQVRAVSCLNLTHKQHADITVSHNTPLSHPNTPTSLDQSGGVTRTFVK